MNKKVSVLIMKVLGGIILLIIILAICLPFLFQKQIVTKVKQSINDNLTAKVEFKDYSLSLFRSFPDFTLTLEQLTVSGTGDFDKDTLVKADDIRLSLDLLSVFGGKKYVLKKISLINPGILLKTLKNGKVNWDITKPTAISTTAEAPSAPFKLSINKVSIEDGKMIYDDASMGVLFSLAGINMNLKADINGDVTDIETHTTAKAMGFSYGGISYLKNAVLDITSGIQADIANFKFVFRDTELKLNDLGVGFSGWFAMPKDDMLMDLKFEAHKNEFKNFLSLVPAIYAKDFDKVETKGTLAFNGFVKGTYNDKKIPSFGLNLLVSDGMFHYPALPGTVKNININMRIANSNGQPDNTSIDIRKFHVEMGSNKTDVSMTIATPVSDPSVNGTIKASINLGEVKQFYPLDPVIELSGNITADVALKGRMSSIEKQKYEEFQAKGELALTGMNYKSKEFTQGLTVNSFKLLFTPQSVVMPVCDVRFGKSDLKASGTLSNFIAYALKNETLKGTFESRSNLIDLNEFMGGETTETTPKDTTSLTVIRVPGNLDFIATTSIGKLLYDNMVMSNVSGGLKVSDEKITLNNLKINMLGGSITVNGDYNSKPQNPAINFNLDVSKFDIPSCYTTFMTVKKLAPVAEKCSGNVSVKMNISTDVDKHMSPVYETMNAKGLLNAEKLEVKDFILMNKLSEALKIEKFKQMNIGSTSLEFSISKGRLDVRPYTFKMDKVSATMSGWNSLDQSISYDAVLEIPRELFGGQANAVLEGMVKKAGSQGVTVKPGSTIVVAAKMKGTFLNPVITTDIKNSVQGAITEIKQQVQEKVTEKVNQEVVKVKEDVSAKAQKMIADAEAKAQLLKDEARKTGDQLIKEADNQGKKLIDNSSNPVAKMAAKETAKKMSQTAKNKSYQLQQEANTKANKLIEDARKEAAKL